MKKVIRNLVKGFLSMGMAFTLLASIVSCGEDSGLGSSVDTEAPKISIDYPPTDAIIQQNFVVAGTWSDDKSLNTISVEVKKTDTKTVVYSDTAAINSDGSWSISLNNYDSSKYSDYNGWQFCDGSYEISVTAKDDAGHSSGKSSRSVVIDNTAPVLVLTKPTSVGSATPKSYGQTVLLEGTFSESCSSGISGLTVSFYDAEGNKLFDSEFSGITDMSNANSLVIAQYYDENNEPDVSSENYEKWQNYKALIGEDNIALFRNGQSVTTKEFYFTVTANDEAKVYKDSSDSGEGNGNSTTTYYRGTTDMLQLINGKKSSFENFTVSTLRTYLNGTDSTYSGNTELQEILDESVSKSTVSTVLSSDGTYQSVSDDNPISESIENTSTTSSSGDSQDVYLNFTINPENNPTYTVSGLTITEGGASDSYSSNGYFLYYSDSTINVSIAPGLDNTNLDTSTISVYYTNVTDASSEKQLFWTWDEETAVKYAMAKDNCDKTTALANVTANPSAYRYTVTTSDENTDALSVTSSLSSSNAEISTGKEYKFSIEGYDIDSQAIVEGDSAGYGFMAKSNSTVPTITFGDTAGNVNLSSSSAITKSVITGGTFGFSGTVYSSEELTSSGYTVVLADTESSSSKTATGSLSLELDSSSSEYTYNWNFTFAANSEMQSLISSGSGLYTVDVTVSATNGGGTSSKLRSFYLDTTNPAISNVAISTGYTLSDIIYINNNAVFTLSGTTTDNYIVGSTTYTFTGVDSSGKAKTVTGTSSSISWSFTGVDLSEFGTQSSASDVVLTVKACDKAGNDVSETYEVEFDTTKPAWTESNTSHPFKLNKASYDSESWYKDSSLPVSGCFVEEGCGVSSVYYWVQNPDSSVPDTSDFTEADGSFSVTNDSENGISYFTNQVLGSFTASTISGSTVTPNYLYLVAVDNVGNAGSAQVIEINIDTESPSLSSDKSGTQYTNGESSISVTGSSSDNVSGIASVTLKIGTSSVEASVTEIIDSSSTNKTSTWSAEISSALLSALSDGSMNVNATVKDTAGNSSSSTIFQLQKDTSAPSVSVTTPSQLSTINGTVSISGQTTYTGATPDSLALYYSLTAPSSTPDVSSMTKIGAFTDSSKIYSWTFDDIDVYTLSGVTEASPTASFYIVSFVTDTAGNSSSSTFTYTVDQNKDRPIIKLTSVSDSSSWITSDEITGTVSDDDGIANFYISETSASSGFTEVSVENGSWSYTIKSSDGEGIPLYFKVIDTAGTTFVTGGVTDKEFTRPYYLYSKSTSSDSGYAEYGFDNTQAITLNLDREKPQISTLGLAIAESESNLAGVSAVKEDTASYAVSASRYAGGDSKYIKIYAPVYDSNISGVTVSITDTSSAETESTVSMTASSETLTVSGVTYSYYETASIDVSGFSSGTKALSVTVTDGAGNSTSSSGNFYLDNTGPDTITITSPSSSDEITGTATITGTASDSGIGIDTIEWLVPPVKNGTNYGESSVTDEALLALDGWTSSNNSGSASVWKFKFQASSTLDLTQFDDTENFAVTYSSASETYKIPIYFKTTDKLGNYYIKRDYYITHNPDADRPVTEFSYPTSSDYDVSSSGASLDYVTLAGTIRISGTVEVPSGTVDVGQVYVQIGTVASDGTVTWSSTNSALSAEFTTLGGVITESGLSSTYASTSKVPDGWWGIAATTKTATWNLSLNTNSDLDPESGSTTNIAVRACAINADGKMGNWSDIYFIHVDSNAPSQSAVMRQYSSFSENALESNVSVSRDYTSEMYLKGTWYLTVTLEDNDSLNEDTISVKKGSASQSYSAGEKTTVYASDGTTVKSVTKTLYIPIETEEMTSSSVSYTVYVADTAGYSSSMTYTFYIDNTAPVISTFTVNDTYSLLDSSSVPVIQNSNYKTTLDGTLTESGSGCERLFFYFMRDNVTDGSSPRLLDAMVKDSESVISGLDSYTITQDSTNTYTMYGKTYSGSLDTARTSFTASSGLIDDEHIRAGGLIYIGGEYQLITSVSGNTVTFDTAVSSAITVEEAGFPYGQVVDSTDAGNWNDSTHTYASISESDGDSMVEIFKKTGTTWEWQGIFLSDYMADGPVTVVVIAFDAAGNVSGKSVSTSIQNNAPRLAKLYLGTDLSGDEKYASSEFNTYTFNTYTSTDASNPTANYKDSVDFETAGTTYSNYKKAFQIRSGLAVIPEITGGNGTIKMAFLKDASGSTGYVKSANASGFYAVDTESLITADFASSLLTNTTTSEEDSLHKFVIPDDDLASLSDGSGKSMSFTFWDSTDGTTCGTDSNYCFVRITDFTVARTDGTAPKSVINPFHWTSKTDNSLYGNSSANGHIELEGDWASPETAGYSSSASSGQFDSDPKVSGKITMTGYAYDDQRLSSLWIAFDTFTPSGYYSAAGDSGVTANSVAASSGTYVNSGTNGDSKTYYQAAYYTPSTGSWTYGSSTMASNGWEFSVSDSSDDGSYLDQSGHKVIWKLSIDTEKISSVAATDVKARVIALDRSYNVVNVSGITSTLSETDGSDNVPLYQMDVVPYISSMTAATAVSGTTVTKRTNSIRSRRGAVPVQNSDYIVINGFNLSTSFYRQLEANKSAVSTLTDTITGTAITANESYYISAPTYSGYIIAKTNGIYSLNNMNADTAYSYESSSTNTYDTESDSSLDHYFDDRYVWVWRTDYLFADSAQAISPTMEVFPSSGTYYTTATSSSTTAAGTVYGSWSSDAAMFYTEKLGGSRGNPLGTTSWKDSPDDADMCIINGIPFHVILDNWQGSGSDWSSNGLFITRDGKSFSTGTASGATAALTAGTLEIQGNATSASPDSSDGADEMMFQFKNPKIAGTYSGNTYYTYACYFDNYAKCLKYGKITWSGTTPTAVVRTAVNHVTDGYAVVDGYDTTVTGYSDYAANVGKYSDIVLDTVNGGSAASPIPVIAYCVTNVSNGDVSLRIARGKSTAPSTTGAVVTSEGTTPTGVTRGWYYTDVTASNSSLIPSGVQLGNYVSMAIDATGNLHIATQDAEDGDLYYIYLTYSSAADSGYTVAACCKVDSANSVGKWTDIKLESSSGSGSVYGLKCAPVISYLDATNIENKKAVKTAFVSSSTSATSGIWEHMTSPATYAANDEKSSLVLSALDSGSVSCKLGIGYQSASFATAFLRGEQ
ncbi:hypothetical protein [Treponema sp.]|uniref:hypothetical protein n=1 Tax=Treponema sp. TaxID=166 RepID=UPI00388EA3D4